MEFVSKERTDASAKVMEILLVQEDYDGINRLIEDLEDLPKDTPKESNEAAWCVFEGLKDAIENLGSDKELILSKLTEKSRQMLDQWNGFLEFISRPKDPLQMLIESLMKGKGLPDAVAGHKHPVNLEECASCPSKDECDDYAEAMAQSAAPTIVTP